jgi:hypothetical protein
MARPRLTLRLEGFGCEGASVSNESGTSKAKALMATCALISTQDVIGSSMAALLYHRIAWS